MHKLVLILRALIITLGVMGLFFTTGIVILMIITAVIEWIKGVDNLEPLENKNEVYH